MATQMILQLGIKPSDRILDFGCAKGFLVKAFQLLHYNAYGVDISDYAINQAPNDIRHRLALMDPEDSIPGGPYDWVIAKDVLEHVPYDCIDDTLSKLREASHHLLMIVPLGKDGKYVIPEYELDKTHQIREPLMWWRERLLDARFNIIRASYQMQHIKANWSQWEFGNAFFALS
jgi:SAM-dependent methyltransferase